MNVMLQKKLVITDASGEGYAHILKQKGSEDEVEARAQATNNAGEIHNDTGWVVIQVGYAAHKPACHNYSTLELEVTCAVWSLKTLAYYFNGFTEFDLWTDHSPLVYAMKKKVREMTPRIQKFREAIQACIVPSAG